MKADPQVLKGHLDMLLLASLEEGPRHGYAVKEALRAGSGAQFDLPTGTIYPALRRLEAAGLVREPGQKQAAVGGGPMNSPRPGAAGWPVTGRPGGISPRR